MISCHSYEFFFFFVSVKEIVSWFEEKQLNKPIYNINYSISK